MHYEWVLLQLTECSFTHLSSIGIGESFSFGFSCFSLSAAIFISNVWTCGFGLIVLYVPYISKSFDNCGSNLSTPSLFRSCSKRPYKPSVFWKSESDCSVNESVLSPQNVSHACTCESFGQLSTMIFTIIFSIRKWLSTELANLLQQLRTFDH